EAHYGKSLHEVVGIVTPFSAKVSTIKQVLGKQGISTGKNEKSLTVGTVHSLQGAKRAANVGIHHGTIHCMAQITTT
ncbi:hypothetical protein O5853_32515, partial [Escherichia coli]|nr:hypothetical protein [Escherichia coli]